MQSAFLLLSAFTALSSAHFTLDWPPTAGFDEKTLGTGPCGGATVVVNSSATEIQVDRFAIQISNGHPDGKWSYRATLSTEEPYNFTQIVPVVNTTGLGVYCLEYMHAPAEWAGKQGIIQVIDDSIDGQLYQCAPVTFVAGSNSTRGPTCTNSSSSFTAVWTNQEISANGSDTSGASTTSSAGGSAATGDTTTTSSGLAAVKTMGVGSFVGGLGLLAYGLL